MNGSFSRLISLMRKEFIQILRDPRTLFLMLLIPIIQMLLLGYAANNDIRNIPLAVFDQDRGPAARRLLDAYQAADYFRLAYSVNSEEELRNLIENGQARAAMIIPPDYGSQVESNGTGHVVFILDGSDPSVATNSLAAARLIAQQQATEILLDRLAKVGQSMEGKIPVEVHTTVWYNPDMVSAHFMVPGVIAMVLYAVTSILTASTVVRERERGTIEQLIVTPIRSWELLIGKLMPYAILAFIDTLEVLVLGSLIFKVPIRADLALVLLLSGLFLLVGLGIGLLISTVSNTQQEAVLLAFFSLMPSIFLAGFLFPLSAMPKVLQWISVFIPLRYYLVIIRSLLMKGSNLASLRVEIFALVLFAIGFIGLAVLRFRKRLD
jgi:ABC-2 type transport system permease protein